jgi:hypothetical protein
MMDYIEAGFPIGNDMFTLEGEFGKFSWEPSPCRS